MAGPAGGFDDDVVAGERADGGCEGGCGEEGAVDGGGPGAGSEDEAGAGDVGFGVVGDGLDAHACEVIAYVFGD